MVKDYSLVMWFKDDIFYDVCPIYENIGKINQIPWAIKVFIFEERYLLDLIDQKKQSGHKIADNECIPELVILIVNQKRTYRNVTKY